MRLDKLLFCSCILSLISFTEIIAQRPPPPPPPPPPCPPTCDCTNRSNVTCSGGSNAEELDFDGLGLTEVPILTGRYPRLLNIDLDDNSIGRLGRGSFGSNFAPLLNEIELRNNRITVIEVGAFSGPIEIIDLRSNRLTEFNTRHFENIGQTLRELYLGNNEISEFHIQPSFNFEMYPNLMQFDISNNLIYCDSTTPWELSFAPLCENFLTLEVSLAECIDSNLAVLDVCDIIRSSFTTDNGGNNSDSEPTNESSINNLPSPGVSDSSLENPRMDSTSSIPGIFVGSPGVPMMNGGEGSNNLSLIVGLAVGIPVAIVGILVMSLLLLFFRRSRMWERTFQDATEAQVETTLRLNRTIMLKGHSPSTIGPRYTTGPFNTSKLPPETPPPAYNAYSETTFFPGSDDASIEKRPLPMVPQDKQAGADYEDGYILNVQTVPKRDVLPGIAIAKRRDEEARRLSMYPAPQKSKPKDLIPCTDSDSETENEVKPKDDISIDTHKTLINEQENETSEVPNHVINTGTMAGKQGGSVSGESPADDAALVENEDMYLSIIQ